MRKRDETIPLTKEQKKRASEKIREYVSENFEAEIGSLQAEIFLDFITKNIGAYYYNRAVADSIAFVNEKTEDMFLLLKDEEE